MLKTRTQEQGNQWKTGHRLGWQANQGSTPFYQNPFDRRTQPYEWQGWRWGWASRLHWEKKVVGNGRE